MEHCKIKKITKLPFEQLRFEKLTYATVPNIKMFFTDWWVKSGVGNKVLVFILLYLLLWSLTDGIAIAVFSWLTVWAMTYRKKKYRTKTKRS